LLPSRRPQMRHSSRGKFFIHYPGTLCELTTLLFNNSATPAVTAVTTPSDGYGSGDLVALLDKDLASRIDATMHRAINCQDGQAFDSQHPSSKKRAGATLGQAICAAEAVAAGAVPGGPFNDLLLLSPTNLPFGFADAAGATAQAAGVVADFVLAYAPMLTIGPELADQLSVYLFALAIDTIVQNIPLADQNRIQSSMVTTGTTTSASSTSSGCPDPTGTPVSETPPIPVLTTRYV
jgi:hypothetical protein